MLVSPVTQTTRLKLIRAHCEELNTLVFQLNVPDAQLTALDKKAVLNYVSSHSIAFLALRLAIGCIISGLLPGD